MAEQKKAAAKVKRPTAIKRDIQSRKRREANRQFKSRVKTALRRFDETLKEGDAAEKNTRLSQVYQIMDKGVKKGVVPANAAKRTKSRLALRLASQG